MNGRRRQPGATGVADLGPLFDEHQHARLQEWIRSQKILRIDAEAFCHAVEASVRLYVGGKELAVQSSAKAVKRNLKSAFDTAESLVRQLIDLDGNSKMLISRTADYRSLLDDAKAIRDAAFAARAHAEATLPGRSQGQRRRTERDTLAAMLRDALEQHTSLKPSSTYGQPFEELLRLGCSLAGETYNNLHTLAERALARDMISRPLPGLTVYEPWETAPKRRDS